MKNLLKFFIASNALMSLGIHAAEIAAARPAIQKSQSLEAALANILKDADQDVKTAMQGLNGIEYKCPTDESVEKQTPENSNSKQDQGPEFTLSVTQQLAQRFERVGYSQANFDQATNLYVKETYGALSKRSLAEIKQIMIEDAKAEDSRYSAQEMFDSYLRQRLVESSEQERPGLLQQAGELMSFEQQLAFVAKFGGNALANFDPERAQKQEQGQEHAQEFIACNDIFNNLNETSKLGANRDISMCQAKLLDQMGNKGNVYMVSYATVGNVHSSVIASDPKNPAVVHKISYDSQSAENTLRGVPALGQDHQHPDVSITFRLYKPSGEMVGSLPSEMGLVLNKMTGGNNKRDFDPFIEDQYNITATGVEYKGVNAKIFKGKLSNGEDISGGSIHKDWNQSLIGSDQDQQVYHQGRVGAAAAYRRVEVIKQDHPEERKNYRALQVYAVGEDELVIMKKIGGNKKIEPYVRGRIAGSGVLATENLIEFNNYQRSSDVDMTVDYGIRAETKLNDDRTKVSVDAHQQYTIGAKAVNGLPGKQSDVANNHMAISSSVNHRSGRNTHLIGQATYAQREYGASAGVDAGVQLKDGQNETIIVAGYYTPVGKKVQGWQPGGGNAGFSARIMRQIREDDMNVGVTLFRAHSGLWYINSELGIRWE